MSNRNKMIDKIARGDFEKRTLSFKEAADYLGISSSSLTRWIDEGFPLETFKINNFDTGRYRLVDVLMALGELEEDEAERIYQENRREMIQKGIIGRKG